MRETIADYELAMLKDWAKVFESLDPFFKGSSEQPGPRHRDLYEQTPPLKLAYSHAK